MADLRLCSIPDCGKPSRKKGMCANHYYRQKTYGDASVVRHPRHGSVQSFFKEVVLVHDGDDCLLWPYANTDGYGIIRIDGKNHRVSRLVCEAEHGPAPEMAMDAAHSCGKGHLGCVSRRHLSWKTRADNLSDKILHGTHAFGEKCSYAKLNEEDVRVILSLKGVVRQIDLATRYNVSKGTINNIMRGVNWKHLRLPQPSSSG